MSLPFLVRFFPSKLFAVATSLLGVTLFLWSALPAQAADVEGLRVYAAPDSTRLVFDLDGAVAHRLQLVNKQGDKPAQLVIEMDNTAIAPQVTQPNLSDTAISQMRFVRFGDFNLRVTLDLKYPIHPKSFVLKPSEPYSHRLVVDLFNQSAAQPIEAPTVTQSALRDILIVIDAGHGGEDPGALGPNRLREKDITLKIAKKLADLVNAKKGYRAELTRKGDYYIDLRSRSRVAQQKNADLFVSIHADAFKNKNAAGASVFAWSQRGATSETARFLADKENLSDLVGGADPRSLDDTLVQVLADLQLEGTVRLSLGMGKSVLREMGGISKLHKQHVEQAGFMVLKSVKVPSLLIETGFISNPGEAKKLSDSTYQGKMASAIFTGIENYFNQIPLPGTYVAANKAGYTGSYSKPAPEAVAKPVSAPKPSAPSRAHAVKRGETLSSISIRYNVTISALKKHNNLKSTNIYVGQKLKIPD